MKFLGRINMANGRHPNLGKFYLFSFPPWKEWMDAFKCWGKSILF